MKKENNQKYWFVRREYGWGWVPASKAGKLTILIWIIAFISALYLVDRTSHSISDTFYGSLVPLILITLIIWIICWIKGEPPKWQWGKK